MAIVKFPRLNSNMILVDKDGHPNTTFTRFWDEAMTELETFLNAARAAESPSPADPEA